MPPSEPPGNNNSGRQPKPGEGGVPGGSRKPTGSVPAAPGRTGSQPAANKPETGNVPAAGARPGSGSVPAATGRTPTGSIPAASRTSSGNTARTASGTATPARTASRAATELIKPKRRMTFFGCLFALVGIAALAGIVGVAGYLGYVAFYAPVKVVDAPLKPHVSAPMPVDPVPVKDDRLLLGKMLKTDDGKSLLDKQSVETRRKILIVDLFLQMTGGYPDVEQQEDWLEPTAPLGRAVDKLLEKGAPENEIANFVAATVMETKSWRERMPEISQLKPSGKPKSWLGALPAYGAPTVGAMISRAVGYRKDIDRKSDAMLIQKLADGYDALGQSRHASEMLTRMLRAISGSTDVNEHWLADQKDDAVELEAMKTNLRTGRWIVANGVDENGDRRTVVLWGFDRRGDLLIHDPAEHLPERLPAPALITFLRRPSSAGGPAAGFWLDVSSRPTRVHCEQRPVLAKAPAEELFLGEGGMTGVIPGAQVGLTSLRIPPGEHTIRGTLTITSEQIDQILREGHSPAEGAGKSFVRWGRYYNIDPVYALAFFRRESVFGAHPRWIGRMPDGGTTKNIGNIRYVGAPDPDRLPQYHSFNGFRAYDTWDDGIRDWFKLLAQDSNYAGLHTVERILWRYAPSTENDTANYIRDVILWAGQWRARALAGGAKVASAAEAKKVEEDLMTCSAPEP